MAIDWNWPIEFLDGTPAWLDGDEPGEHGGIVCAVERPHGLPMSRDHKGRYRLLVDRGEARLRNVELPVIRFCDDSSAPTGGVFSDSGRAIRLYREANSEINVYDWPSFKPRGSSVPVSMMTRKQLAKEEEEKVEAVAMEENELYGLF
jgi:hypothetical protein